MLQTKSETCAMKQYARFQIQRKMLQESAKEKELNTRFDNATVDINIDFHFCHSKTWVVK